MQQRPENLFASSLSIAILGPATAIPLLVAGCAGVSVTNPRLLCRHFATKNALRVNQTLQLADPRAGYGVPSQLLCQQHPRGARGDFLVSQRSFA